MTRQEVHDTLLGAALAQYDRREAGAVAAVLAAELFGFSRADRAVEPGAGVPDAERLPGVLADIAAGRPVQYITGRAWFCGRSFGVGEGVLVPRPETGEMVGAIARTAPRGAAILDIGTGSGAIAVSLALDVADSRVVALDISDAALRRARGNAGALGAEVEFLRGDILDATQFTAVTFAGKFDIIVSNPPYIPAHERASMHRNVTEWEPAGALFVGDDDPLVFYKAIAPLALGWLVSGGWLWFEVHEAMGGRVARELDAAGFVGTEIIKDINGRDRIVRCRKK